MSKKWTKLISREGVDVLTICGLDIAFYDGIKFSFKNTSEPFFTLVKDRVLTHYMCVDSLLVGRKIYKHYFSNPSQTKKHYSEGLKLLRQIEKRSFYWKKFRNKNSSELEKAFQECWEQFMEVNYRFSIWPWWGLESWQIDCDDILKKLIKRRTLQDLEEVLLATIYKPWKDTAIIKLQKELKGKKSASQLVQKYQFLRSWSLAWFKPIDATWIKNFAQTTSKNDTIKTLPNKKLLQLLKPTKQERYFIGIAPYIIFFKDWRDDVRRKQVYSWSFLFDELAKHFSVPREDLGYLSPQELLRSLKTNLFPFKIVKNRKTNGCIVTGDITTLSMEVLDRGQEKYRAIIGQVEKSTKKQTVITGLTAQAGIVQGYVKVIRSYHDTKRLVKGEILVANTTHPNYLPAMHRAAAFVTNEGGIISHAAIVAREMKKPCIVGTKIATKIFKDGDLVEVDAIKGIIKKI